MVPLEVTHTALVTTSVLESINKISSNFTQIITELLLFFKSTYKTVFRMNDPPLHDPCAVAFVINPELFEFRLMRVDIETASSLSYGQTVCDVYDMSKKRKNVHVCFKMKVDKFWNLMLDAIQTANTKTPIN
jgi:inosine-uridine nucleoside N-ribohydrolase